MLSIRIQTQNQSLALVIGVFWVKINNRSNYCLYNWTQFGHDHIFCCDIIGWLNINYMCAAFAGSVKAFCTTGMKGSFRLSQSWEKWWGVPRAEIQRDVCSWGVESFKAHFFQFWWVICPYTMDCLSSGQVIKSL